jgi:hypothetical protein
MVLGVGAPAQLHADVLSPRSLCTGGVKSLSDVGMSAAFVQDAPIRCGISINSTWERVVEEQRVAFEVARLTRRRPSGGRALMRVTQRAYQANDLAGDRSQRAQPGQPDQPVGQGYGLVHEEPGLALVR